MCREYSNTRGSSASPSIACNSRGTIIGPVSEVHFVQILDECDTEVAIQSISNPENKFHVVISRETERFVNDIHTHLQESENVTTCFKETWADPSAREIRAGSIHLTPNEASIFTRRTIPKHEKRWIVIHANSKYGEVLTVSISNDREERESDGSRHQDSMKPVLEGKFCT